MVDSSSRGQEDVRDVGLSHGGLVRVSPEQKTPGVLLPTSRPNGPSDGRLSDAMGQSGSLRFSPIQPDSKGHQSSVDVLESQDDPGGPSSTTGRVVSGPAGSASGSSKSDSPVEHSSTTTSVNKIPSRRRRPAPSRLETIQHILRKRGFSRRTAREMSCPIRESSSRVYDGKWSIFCSWCRKRKIYPSSATVPQVADFLTHLRLDEGLSVSAIQGYRSSLNQVLALKGRDLSTSREISMLIRRFKKSCPPREVRPPEWDLSLVLRSLRSPPFEPLCEASDRDLTLKTVFLLALASAKRVGELHALSHRVRHSEGWHSLSFSFVPEFVAKTQNPSVYDPRFEEFEVPSLRDFTGDDPDEMLLCPVRAVRQYLKRTRQLRPACNRLFIATGRNKKEVSKNTISFWLREVIKKAYHSSEGGVDLPRVRAHEVRGIAPSLLFKRNFAVEQVLKAGTWKNQTTFSSFYLRDITHKSLDTFSLGPVVAAQRVV